MSENFYETNKVIVTSFVGKKGAKRFQLNILSDEARDWNYVQLDKGEFLDLIVKSVVYLRTEEGLNV